MYQDQTLTCKDCGQDFVWTASEQEFYAGKGFSAPVRCPACRMKNKQAKQGGTGGGRFDRGPRQMYEITCANCGAKGEVPFEPRDPSNVLCADCFRKKRDAERGIETPAQAHTHAADDSHSMPADDMPADDTSSSVPADDMTDNGDDSAANDADSNDSDKA